MFNRSALIVPARQNTLAIGLILVASIAASVARAQTSTWTNDISGVFNVAGNWTGGVPVAGDIAVFNAIPNAYTVTFSIDPINQTLRVQNGSVTFGLGGHTYTLTGVTSIGDVAAQIGRLTLGNGALQSVTGTVGFNGTGFMTVGAGALWNLSSTLVVGDNASGNLTISGGGHVICNNSSIGNPSAATVTVTGSGSTWTDTGVMGLGQTGAGTLNINSGGVVTSGLNNHQTQIAPNAGSAGTAVISGSGSAWNVGLDLNVGGGPSTPGGTATVTLTLDGTLDVAGIMRLWPGGTVKVEGGVLSITSVDDRGGAIHFNSGTIDYNASSLGSATMTTLLGPAHSLGPGRTLDLQAGSLGATLALDGGTLIVPSLLANSPLLLNSGTLNLQGSLTVGASGPLGGNPVLNSGMNVTCTGVIVQSGALLQLNGGRISATGSIANNGEIQLLGGPSQLSAGSISNGGLLSGDGRVAARLVNNPAGIVRALPANKLTITGTSNTNTGTIDLLGGTLEMTDLTNNPTGKIIGQGNLITSALVNNGTMTLSGGTTQVKGTLSNGSFSHVTVTGGSNSTFQDNVTNTAGAVFKVSEASIAAFLGSVTGMAAFTGPGTKIFEGSVTLGPVATDGSSIVESTGAMTVQHVREDSLTINGTVTILPNGTSSGTSRVNSLTIAGAPDAWTGKLDLNDNDLVIDYIGVSPLSTVRNQLKTGRAGGVWSGNGIASSMANSSTFALGSADNAILGLTTFSGQSVDLTSILVKYTYYGDTDLDGDVDIADLGSLATSWQTAAVWTGGDFDYNGTVDVNDLGLLASNWQAGVGNPLGPPLEQALSGLGLPNVTVPEPTEVGLMLAVALKCHCRRRRR